MDQTKNDHLTQNERELLDLAEFGWIVLANASGGDWDKEHPDWKEAAGKYRDRYHDQLRKLKAKGYESCRSPKRSKDSSVSDNVPPKQVSDSCRAETVGLNRSRASFSHFAEATNDCLPKQRFFADPEGKKPTRLSSRSRGL